MKLPSGILAISIVVIALAAFAHAQSSGDELKLGVDAYKAAHLEESALHFQKATELDPNNIAAHMYLATTCTSLYLPGVDTPDNLQRAEQAMNHYQHVLDSDAAREQKLNSAKGIGYLYLNMKKFEDARKYYQIATELDPKDPEPLYSIGVLDWTLTYQPRMEERAKLGMKPEENLNPKNADQRKVCDDLRAKNTSTIEGAIDALSKAIELRPDYDDAMAYLNLMYREKADLECDDLAARAQDLKTADHWVDMTLGVKRAKASQPTHLNPPIPPNPQ